MIRQRTGTVLRVLAERPGAVELAVDVEGVEELAVAYPAMLGEVVVGTCPLLNTTAVELGLGTAVTTS